MDPQILIRKLLHFLSLLPVRAALQRLLRAISTFTRGHQHMPCFVEDKAALLVVGPLRILAPEEIIKTK